MSYALPSSNLTIDFCYTLKLPKNIRFQTIHLSYLTDVNIFIHYPNQFLYSWINKRNVFAASSAINFKRDDYNTIEIYDLNVNYLIKKNIGLPEMPRFNYDECILNLKLNNNKMVKDYVNSPLKTIFLQSQLKHESIKRL